MSGQAVQKITVFPATAENYRIIKDMYSDSDFFMMWLAELFLSEYSNLCIGNSRLCFVNYF